MISKIPASSKIIQQTVAQKYELNVKIGLFLGKKLALERSHDESVQIIKCLC